MFLRTSPLFTLLAMPAVLAATPGRQAPHAPWQTLQTAHYRIHYPPLLADWAQDVAGRIEGIHSQVTAVVGYASPEPVQVLLMDPAEEANGRAMPLLGGPYVVLWKPAPRSDNLHGGAMTSWTELLTTHELTHIHHLLRPTRKANVLTSLFGLPLGPLVLKAPRWVHEGYATLVEGHITGSGRPHSAIRAMILRQWALAGRLPAYEDLNGNAGYLGGNMAYMVGSAYLEWLERQRPGQPTVLQNLWKQLASRKGRTFEVAFQATFGFKVQDGYHRFQAETSHDALEWEARIKAEGLRQGELWLRAEGGVTELSVSPDGTRLLARLEGPQGGLRVWELVSPAKPPKKTRAMAPDPLNEVADAPPEWVAPKLHARLPALNGQQPDRAQWVDDRSILFQLKHPDGEGSLHRRPALWRLEQGVDTCPATAPAPRWRTLEPIHRDGRWRLELDGQTVPLPGQPVGIAFLDTARHQILASCELDGIWNLVRVPYAAEGGTLRFEGAQRLTRTASAAWNPAPSPDGRWLYFTSLDARGTEIRKLDLTLPPLETAPGFEPRILNQATVMPPALEAGTLPAPVAPPAPHPYRAVDNLNNQVASGATLTPSGTSYQLGGGGSDLLGRLSWQVLAGFGSGAGPRGASMGFSTAAWRWKPSVHVFSALERPSLQRTAPVQEDQERRGAEFTLERDHLGAPRFWVSPVVAWERVQRLTQAGDGPLLTRSLAGVRTGLQALWGRGEWIVTVRPAADLYTGNTHTDAAGGSQSWTASRASLDLHLATPWLGFALKGERGQVGGSSGERFHLGGATTSLVPLSLDLNRVEQLALPSYTATGDCLLRFRGEVGDLLKVYLEGNALWNAGQERQAFQRVMGLELAVDLATPGEAQVIKKIRFELGLHRPLDGVMKGRTVGTLSLVVRP